MKTIILIGHGRDGKDQLLAGSEVPFQKQVALYKDLAGKPVNEKFKSMTLGELVEVKRFVRFAKSTPVHATNNNQQSNRNIP